MKTILTVVSVSLLSVAARAQSKSVKPAKTSGKPAASSAATSLKTSSDSLSYALGMNTALFFKSKGITNINSAIVAKAVDDVLKGRKLPMNEEQMNQCAMDAIKKVDGVRVVQNKKDGAAFLAKNKLKQGVITLPSGLQYEVIKEGTGAKPVLTDIVKVHYHGTLTDGTVFESSVRNGQPIEIGVNQVIAGWTEALQMMPVGSKWRLFIPSNLAYGDRDAGPMIKAGSTLIFEVELLEIVKPQ